jgi:acyl-CoA synthetase (AMP-forming)/AMP-acid ligase II
MPFINQLIRLRFITPRTLFLMARAKAIHGRNLSFLLKLAADRFSEKTALTDGNLHINFREQYDAVLRLSFAIRNSIQDIENNSAVVFACNNTPVHIIFLFALQNLGIKVILVNHKAHINDISSIREKQPQPCYLFTAEPEHLQLQNVCHIDKINASSANGTALSKKYAPVVFPTSGTTGQSKLIEKKPGIFYWLRSFAHLTTHTGIYKREAVYIASPVSHGLGYSALMFALVLGKKAMLTDNKNQQQLTELLIREKIDLLAGVPSSMYRVAENMKGKKHFIRLVISGGAPLNEVIMEDISQHLTSNIFGIYGSTEASTSFVADYEMLKKNIHALGRPLKGIQYRLEPQPGGGKELLIRSHLANISAFEWLHSGDLAEEDENGNLIWCGRKDNMIIKNGVNIFPAEIENALLRLDSIEDVYVTGEEDNLKGENIIAFVKSNPSLHFDEQKIKEGLKSFLPGIKIPDKIIQTKSFEFTNTGKKVKPLQPPSK